MGQWEGLSGYRRFFSKSLTGELGTNIGKIDGDTTHPPRKLPAPGDSDLRTTIPGHLLGFLPRHLFRHSSLALDSFKGRELLDILQYPRLMAYAVAQLQEACISLPTAEQQKHTPPAETIPQNTVTRRLVFHSVFGTLPYRGSFG